MERAVVMVHKLKDAEVERLSYRQDSIKQEAAAEDGWQGDGPSSGSCLEVIYIKSEVPDAELEAVTVKEEPSDWHQEPQASSSSGSHAVTFKKEVDDDCTEASLGRAEAENELREGSSGACNTSAVHQAPAGASRGSAASLPSDVSGSGSGVEAAPPGRLVSRPLLCAHCDYSTGRRGLMEVHLRISHKLGCYFECELCDYSTMYMSTLKRHVMEQHDHENLYDGLPGSYQYQGSKITREQRRDEHGQEELKCDFCSSPLVTKSSSETPKNGALDNSIVYKCEVCEYSSANGGILRQYLSGECGRGYQSKHGQGQLYLRNSSDYTPAQQNEHEKRQASKDGKGQLFKCKLCDYSSARKNDIKRHLAGKHGKGQLFKCGLCSYSSAQMKNIRGHLASKHSKGQLLKCELCEYSSARKDRINLHLASKHGKGRLFKCELCEYFSARKDYVKLHLASKHGDGQLFKCELCDYTSARKERVKQHRASIHGDGQVFKCKLCEYSSVCKDKVKQHRARKHGED